MKKKWNVRIKKELYPNNYEVGKNQDFTIVSTYKPPVQLHNISARYAFFPKCRTDVEGHLGNHTLKSVAEELFSHLSQLCLHLFMQETDLWILVHLVLCQWIPSGSRQLLSHLKFCSFSPGFWLTVALFGLLAFCQRPLCYRLPPFKEKVGKEQISRNWGENNSSDILRKGKMTIYLPLESK